VLITCVLGSSIAFLDATVVNVALPHIGTSLHTGLAGLQWVVNAYLVALSALVLVGGALGDRYGRRRVFLIGVYGFTAASLAAGVAPSIGALLAARAVQGVAAALLVPASLSLLTATIHPDDRARAVGAWSGLTGVAGAVGPLRGGWLVDAVSWRWVFLLNVPVAIAVLVAARPLGEVGATAGAGPVDVPGGLLAAAGLGIGTAGIIGHGSAWAPAALVGGALLLGTFVIVERRRRAPMLPLSLFGSTQFSGANVVTFVVYAGLGVATFLVVLDLQRGLGYSALQAGAALSPVTLLLLVLSARVGALAQRIGATLPMVVGPVVAAAGLVALSGIEPGDGYVAAVLPGVAILGLGLAITVAPLTAVVMAAVDENRLGVASGVNNAVARLASLVGVAAVPVVAGVDLAGQQGIGLPGYRDALLLAAALCAAGGIVAAFTIRRTRPVRTSAQPALFEPCGDPCVVDDRPAAREATFSTARLSAPGRNRRGRSR
jgi:EmrB/QacA subfamily drug resistance transporter